MATAPTVEACATYLDLTTAEIAGAYAAELAAQARRCKTPEHIDTTDPLNPVVVVDYSDDLNEALYRRVAHNLALRGLPLGLQAAISEVAVATTRVGGLDAEVARLEAPYRRLVVG